MAKGIYFTPPGLCPKCGSRLLFIHKEYDISVVDPDGYPEYDCSAEISDVECMVCKFRSRATIGSDGVISIASPFDRYIYPRETDGRLDNIKEKTFTGNPFITEEE